MGTPEDESDVEDDLVARLVDSIPDSLVPDVLAALELRYASISRRRTPHDSLLIQWDHLDHFSGDPYGKGQALEAFMLAFFGELFEVVEHDFHSRLGEIDLILHNLLSAQGVFWYDYGGQLMAECKNHDKPTELWEVNAFIGKLLGSRCQLGFFVSVNGLTGEALRRIEALAASRQDPLLVPISGEEIEGMLKEGEPFETFFRNRVARTANLGRR